MLLRVLVICLGLALAAWAQVPARSHQTLLADYPPSLTAPARASLLKSLEAFRQRSGKSRRAESLAVDWLAASPDHRAVFIATAQPWDDEMRQRIARHQQDRAQRLPGARRRLIVA